MSSYLRNELPQLNSNFAIAYTILSHRNGVALVLGLAKSVECTTHPLSSFLMVSVPRCCC